jgi:hypothetical protein
MHQIPFRDIGAASSSMRVHEDAAEWEQLSTHECGLGDELVDAQFTQYLSRWGLLKQTAAAHDGVTTELPEASSRSLLEYWMNQPGQAEWKLPQPGSGIFQNSSWATFMHVLGALGLSQHDLAWASSYHSQYFGASAKQLEDVRDACDTYLDDAKSFSTLIRAYLSCHRRLMTGQYPSGTHKARLLVFRDSNRYGWGNVVWHLTCSFLLAVLHRRAFVVDHGSFFNDLRPHLASPPFEWDLDAARETLPDLDSLRTTTTSPGCPELFDDSAEVLVIDTVACMFPHQMVSQDQAFQRILRFFPSHASASIVGALSRLLFQPGRWLEHDLKMRRAVFAGRPVIGLAIRHGSFSGLDSNLLQEGDRDVLDVFFDCAEMLLQSASNASLPLSGDPGGNEALLYAISDTPSTLARVRERFGHRVFTPQHAPIHSKGATLQENRIVALHQTLLDWFTLAEAQDAVLTYHSSYHTTAFARSGRIPVTVDTLRFKGAPQRKLYQSGKALWSEWSLLIERTKAFAAHRRGEICQHRELFNLEWSAAPRARVG